MSFSATRSRRRPPIHRATRTATVFFYVFLQSCAVATDQVLRLRRRREGDGHLLLGCVTPAGCEGVMFDVEEIQSSSGTMVLAFVKASAAAKHAGLRVGETTNHSAPFQCDTPEDAAALVKAWSSANVDFPQVSSPRLTA